MTTMCAPDRPAAPTPTSIEHPFIDHTIIRTAEEAVITATLCPPGVSALESLPTLPALDGTYSLFEQALSASDLPCRVQDADLWFAETPAELEQAKGHCLDCPVRTACLDGALERHEPWGVWGGEIFERGTVVARKRPRGRPRKHAVAA